MIQLAQRAQERLLHDLFAEMPVASDAIKTKAKKRLHNGGRQALDRPGVTTHGTLSPNGIEGGLQDRGPPGFRLGKPDLPHLLIVDGSSSYRNMWPGRANPSQMCRAQNSLHDHSRVQ
jgi:hypothetical protein